MAADGTLPLEPSFCDKRTGCADWICKSMREELQPPFVTNSGGERGTGVHISRSTPGGGVSESGAGQEPAAFPARRLYFYQGSELNAILSRAGPGRITSHQEAGADGPGPTSSKRSVWEFTLGGGLLPGRCLPASSRGLCPTTSSPPPPAQPRGRLGPPQAPGRSRLLPKQRGIKTRRRRQVGWRSGAVRGWLHTLTTQLQALLCPSGGHVTSLCPANGS